MMRWRMRLVASSVAFSYLAATTLLCRMVGWQILPLIHHVAALTTSFSGWRIAHSSFYSKMKRTVLESCQGGDVERQYNSSSSLSAQIIEAVWNSTTIDSIREQLLLLETTATLSGNKTAVILDPVVSSVALRRFTQLLSRNQSNGQEAGSFVSELLPSILDTIESSVKESDVDLGLNVHTDALVSFSVLTYSDSCVTFDNHRLESLAKFIWTERLQKSATALVSSSSPGRMADCLRAAVSLQFIRDKECIPLFEALCERLAQGDALSRLTPFHLVGTMDSLSRRYGKKEVQVLCSSSLSKLITAFARRLRKQNVRSRIKTAALLRTIAATSRLANVLSSGQVQEDDGNAKPQLLGELNTATYTLIKQVLKYNPYEKMRPFVASEAIALLDAVGLLGLDTTNDPVVLGLYARLWRDADRIIESANLSQVALLSKAFLHPNNTNSASLARQIGDKLTTELEAINHQQQLKPWILSALVRYVVLAHPQPLDPSLLKVYQTAVRQCILEPTFLKQSNAVQVSNFCWFTRSTRWNEEAVLHALAHRALESDLQSTCTPKTACRLLYTFTGIFEAQKEISHQVEEVVGDKGEQLLSQLFGCLGEHLLSTANLSPVDLSSAIYAYAKASYVQDIGIFDHLIELLASRMEEATIRQLAQSLWACGKMVGFEVQPDDEVDIAPVPPYYSAALQLAQHLSCHADHMTTKDVAQSLWSLGRLGISDEDVVTPMIHRAQKLAKELNTHEVSSILWAMSRIKSNEYKTVFDLTRRFALSGSTADASSQEAANILYSLGRLNIRDEGIFRNLSHVIMRQIDETSAQAVANVLSAHRTVHLEPPQELLDRWANKKLGIIPVQPKDS